MKLEFYGLSSGSSGNCYYLGNEFHGILIDAGISAGSIRKFLKNINVSINSIMGVLVTHNHRDHVKKVWKYSPAKTVSLHLLLKISGKVFLLHLLRRT